MIKAQVVCASHVERSKLSRIQVVKKQMLVHVNVFHVSQEPFSLVSQHFWVRKMRLTT